MTASSNRSKVKSGALLIAAAALLCGADAANQGSAPPSDLPNPYQTIAPWGKLPKGRKWGALSGIAIDRDGTSLWVADRCGANPDAPAGESPFRFDSCAYSSVPPVLKFDVAGNLLKSFGADMFIFPHKIYADHEGNIWVVDLRTANASELKKNPRAAGKGHVVVKFSPEGKVLMTLGKAGVAGDPPEALNEPTSNAGAPPDTVARISRFTRDGKFVKSFGKYGSGRGEYSTPHDIAMDARGRLFVADRGNNRVQIVDQDGRFIAEWRHFGRPSGVVIRDGRIYVADSESNNPGRNPGWRRGIRIGDVSDGKITHWIPDPVELKGTSAAEGIAVDAQGSIYGAEVGPRQLVKHVRKP
jgi:DNA-binding beta-propeller fold protein YncE